MVAKAWLRAAADYSVNRFPSEAEDSQEKSRNTVFVAFILQHIMVLPKYTEHPRHVGWEDD